MRQFCREGAVIAEIGAHTVPLARTVGPKGRVVAYEPQPIIFQNLCANLALNGLVNVFAYNAGCADEPGTLVFPPIRYDVEGNFGGFELAGLPEVDIGQPVPVVRFDDEFRLPRLTLLKIDVEGMERQAIDGAAATIARYKPAMYVENDRPWFSQALIERLWDLGYQLWWHIPQLFNPENFRGNEANIYGTTCSFNMLCVHRDSAINVEGMVEITDATDHPLKDVLKRPEDAAPTT